jgi:hypothetical protein
MGIGFTIPEGFTLDRNRLVAGAEAKVGAAVVTDASPVGGVRVPPVGDPDGCCDLKRTTPPMLDAIHDTVGASIRQIAAVPEGVATAHGAVCEVEP